MTSSLCQVLSLEKLEQHRYRAIHHKENFQNSLFGGQVLAQALMAAGSTVTELLPHSLHAYFLRAGSSQFPIDYEVSVNRDGRSFSHRTVNALQNGKLIFSLMASFHHPENGYEHSMRWKKDYPMPDPNAVEGPFEMASKHANLHAEAFEFSLLSTNMISDVAAAAGAEFWMRSQELLPTSPLLQACALAYASDFGLLATSLCEHNASLFKGGVIGASIDHALWFHNYSFNVNNWLLYEMTSPWAGNARGLSTGRIYDMDGTLIASSTQEGLIRPVTP
ncbi:MAG: thioesterase family protein [Marinagarivorans sp.]|nr:thioesterase family protein [Marinagarivorans sp.]